MRSVKELCEWEIKKNIIAVDTGGELTRSLKELNYNCSFKKHWDKFCKDVYGDDDQKAHQKAYNQKPEVKAYKKAYQKAYNQKPEVKAHQKAHQKAYYQKKKAEGRKRI